MSTATVSLADPVRIGPAWQRGDDGKFLLPRRTLGWQFLQWTHDYLRQPDGDQAGAPWRYTDEQARFILWWYAVDERGRFVYRRGMLRRLKGWGKDPVGATLCGGELCAPCRFGGWDARGEPVAVPHPAPWVITAAVSLDQTKNTMRLFPSLFSDDAINEYGIDIGKEIIYAHQGRGILEAVTSSPRSLEGKRTTFALKNENHHWLESNDGLAMAEVIARNNTKARGGDARSLAISNAHNPGEGSDAELDHEAYLAMATGRGQQDFLYDSIEAPDGIDITDPEQIRAGLIAARGDSGWLDLDRHVAEILDPRTREGMSRRFYFNQIVAGDDVWLKRSDWDALARPREAEPGTAVVAGFDGSDTDDWTALRCETQDGYQFTPTFPDGKPMVWDPAQHGGYTPRGEVNAAVAHLADRYRLVRLYADPPYWQSEIDEWAARYGDKVVVRWATYRIRQMAEALERFRTDVLAGELSHDGCPITSQHVNNTHADHRPQGVLVRKDKAVSRNKIDAVMSSALAHEAALDATAAKVWPKGRRKLIVMR
jgi:peptidyl-tRNA hydrolase